jgi:hypothetical protein
MKHSSTCYAAGHTLWVSRSPAPGMREVLQIRNENITDLEGKNVLPEVIPVWLGSQNSPRIHSIVSLAASDFLHTTSRSSKYRLCQAVLRV